MATDDAPDPDLLGKPCAYCGAASEGHYSVHRDGFGVGPEVPLCDAHGGSETPSLNLIWRVIKTWGARS